ncbi:MAG: WD40 repeat domain-containing protein, partial [Gemmataceae bacterium]
MSSPPPLLQSPPEPPKVFGAPTFQTDGELLAVGIASDGTLWTVEEPGELRGWNLSNRRQIVARPLDSMATLWTFNWAARLLASASEEVEIWEVSSGTLLASWSTSSWVNAIMFQPGTTLLATGHDDGRLCIWDWATQKLLREIQAHNKAISAVAFHPDRVRIATAGEDKLIHIWDAITGDKRGTLKGHKDRIPALAWHPDERRLFSAGWDTTVRVWDCETFQPIILLNSHSTQVHCLGVTADGRLLASADSNRNLYLWDTQRYQTVSTLQQQGGEIRCMAFTPDDGRGNTTISLLAYGGTDRLVHLWDTRHNMDAGGRDPMLYRTGVAVSPDGHSLFSHSGGSDIRVWDIPSGLASLSVDPLMVRCMALSPDASTLAISSGEVVNGEDRSGKLALFSVASGQKVTDLVGPGDPVTLLAFRPDGSQLASASVRTPDVWLWNLSTGKPELILNDAVENCSVEALAFHPEGSHLAVAGIDWMATGG